MVLFLVLQQNVSLVWIYDNYLSKAVFIYSLWSVFYTQFMFYTQSIVSSLHFIPSPCFIMTNYERGPQATVLQCSAVMSRI